MLNGELPSCALLSINLLQGLFYGYYDGITGLVTEPIKGAKKDVRSKLNLFDV